MGKVAAIEGQVGHPLVVYHLAQFGGFGFEQGSGAANLDRLRNLSNLKGNVHRDPLLHIQIHGYGNRFLESRMFHRHRVAAYPKRTGHVLARIVRGRCQVNATLHVRYRDFGIGHYGASLILDRANDAAGVLLSKCRHRKDRAEHSKKKSGDAETGDDRHGNPP